ncbi:MAG: LacI family DNA-binding transcriptional regulator [Bifidobacterium sp.]|nr:LacI family DNA-binding transcriptional regulator [Bifidobacterium sp.]
MTRRVTLRDVTEAAGVSLTTASLVLNNRACRLTKETRQRVADAATMLRYVPNQSARSLITKRSNLVTLIVPNIENLFFASLANALEQECQRQGYGLIIANSDDSRDREHALIGQLVARGVDGVFLIPALGSFERSEELRADVANVPCPVTLLDRMVTGGWCDGVGFDNLHGGSHAAQCLLEAGHTRVGCLSGIGNANGRRRGFLGTLAEAAIEVDPELDLTGNYRFDSGYQAAPVMAEHGVTAVFCCNDLMASGMLRRFQEMGLRVPDDISLIGYDNILGRFGLPTDVTTVEQRIETLAAEGWRMLLSRIEGRDASGDEQPWLSEPRSELLEPKLITRSTVRTMRPVPAMDADGEWASPVRNVPVGTVPAGAALADALTV